MYQGIASLARKTATTAREMQILCITSQSVGLEYYEIGGETTAAPDGKCAGHFFIMTLSTFFVDAVSHKVVFNLTDF